jgi:hypothetical protein
VAITKAKPRKRAANPAPKKEAPPPLRLEWRSPAELAENPANWRRHPEAKVQALTDVIAEVGWAGACLFNERTERLIDGHARKKVAKPGEKIPVLVGSWSEADEAKILATLDPLAAMAEADKGPLDALLRDVQTGSQAVGDMLTRLAEQAGGVPPAVTPGGGGDDFDARPGPTRTAAGDLWLIRGNGLEHRLIVGDCTDAAVVGRLMGGERVGLCFTSPPYAQQRDYGEAAKEKVQHWYALMCGAFACLPMADDGQVLVNLGLVHREGEWVPYWDGWIEWMRAQGWRRFGWYVWDKGEPCGQNGNSGRLPTAHEWVFHFNKAPRRPDKTERCKHAGESHRGSDRQADGTLEGYRFTVSETKVRDSVFRCSAEKARGTVGEEHPARMSVALASEALKPWPGDVYDPFLGSGTTLVAAHRLGRRCYGCEIEPRYADVILKRAEAEGLTVERAA